MHFAFRRYLVSSSSAVWGCLVARIRDWLLLSCASFVSFLKNYILLLVWLYANSLKDDAYETLFYNVICDLRTFVGGGIYE